MHFVVFSSSLNVNNFLRNIFLQDNGRATTDMFLTFFTRKLVFVRQAVVAITERTSVVRRKTKIGNLGIKFTDALFTSPTLCRNQKQCRNIGLAIYVSFIHPRSHL